MTSPPSAPRVEPSESLRNERWHWLEHIDGFIEPWSWVGPSMAVWARGREVILPEHMAANGWRYYSVARPIPAEVAALRTERDAAVARAEALAAGLEELVKLQSHYAWLLNAHDGGLRKQFHSAAEWMDRMDSPSKIKAALAAFRAANPEAKR